MKKFLSYLMTSVMVISFFANGLVTVRAAVGSPDPGATFGVDKNLDNAGYTTIYNYSDRIQTFKPTRNRITRVNVGLKLINKSESIAMQIIENPDNSPTVIYSSPSATLQQKIYDTYGDGYQFMSGAHSWITFDLSESQVPVVPEASYGVRLIVSGNITSWAYDSGYDRGYFKVNPNTDAFFEIFSQNFSTAAPGKDKEASTSSSSNPVETGKNVASIDSSLEIPKLDYIEVNGEKVEDIKESVEIENQDTVKIYGSSFSKASVVLFLDTFSFSGVAGEDGKWEIEINPSIIPASEYEVTAQAQNDKGKGSDVVSFFKLVKIVEEANIVTERSKELSLWEKIIGPWYWYATATLLGLLLVFVAILGLLQRKHLAKNAHKAKKENDKIDLTQLDKLEKTKSSPKKGAKRVIDITK